MDDALLACPKNDAGNPSCISPLNQLAACLSENPYVTG